jgi:hypothetical protein
MTKREFLDTVFALAPNEANKIMDAFDEYVESNEPHWIPVEQDLPKENYLDDGYVEPSQPVIVYMNYHAYKISRYWGHRKSKGTSDYVIPDWMDLEEYDGDNVIAWRELPEPYKGVTE